MPEDKTPPTGDWYGAAPALESASDWYRAGPAPAEPAKPANPLRREPTERQRRHSRRMKAVTLTVCGVLLCAAAAVMVWHSGFALQMWDIIVRDMQRGTFTDRADVFGYRFGYDFDGTPDSDFDFDFDFGGDALPEEQYEDFREYFDNYFTGSGEIELPAAPTGTGVTLPLQPRREGELSLQEIYEAVSPAVVGITTYLDGEQYSWGTGVVFSPEGYIITNTHVLQNCTDATVIFADGTEYEAMLVGADEGSDIAVLYVEGEDLPYAEFGRSDTLQVGDMAVAIGNPLSQEYTGTMTDGIISAIDRSVTYEGHSMTLLQTNAALNEGNSGGPLINAGGQVIGITNMKIMSSYYNSVEGIGFAIPSSVVKEIADQLIETGVVPGEPTIGIVAGSVSGDAMALYGLPAGLYVSQVNKGSDAEEKGLQEGDVITQVNGQDVTSVADVNAIKEELEVGDWLALTVWRDGKTLELEIQLVDKADIQ